jgi:hypothetical protein
MAQAANIYANMLPQALGGNINLLSDPLTMILLGSGYTPNLFTDTHYSDISAHELSTAGGYTAGGMTLTGKSVTLTTANSWGVTWGATTFYNYGQVVIPPTPNAFLYRCVTAAGGTTAGSAPTFPTVVGDTVVDGGVTWACMGGSILVFTSNPAIWPSSTYTCNYAVIVDRLSHTYSVEPLIVLETFAAAQSPSAQTFEVLPDPVLGWFYFSPPF